MMRSAAIVVLLAILAVVSAGRKANRKSRGVYKLPDASEYLIEGQKLVQPGGVFTVDGPLLSEDAAKSEITACPVDVAFFGSNKFHIDPFNLGGKFVVNVVVYDSEGVASIQESRGDIANYITVGSQFGSPEFSFTVPETGVTYVAAESSATSIEVSLATAPGCKGVFSFTSTSTGGINSQDKTYTMAGESNWMALSDFAIKQTKSGGVKMTGTIFMTTPSFGQGVAGDDKAAVQATTSEFSSTGFACSPYIIDYALPTAGTVQTTNPAMTTVPSGRKSGGGVGKPNKKNGQNPTRNRVCPSYAVSANPYASGTDFYAFSGYFKHPDANGVTVKSYYEILIGAVDADGQVFKVTLGNAATALTVGSFATANFATGKSWVATRVGLADSDLVALRLKHAELALGGNKAYKQAQKSAGYQLGINGQNRVKENRRVDSSFEDDFKKDKPRSWKKRTKNKSVNRRKRRRNKKAAGWRDQLGN